MTNSPSRDRFAAVRFDRRGTLAVAPRFILMVRTALALLHRGAPPEAVEAVLDRLRAADRAGVDAPVVYPRSRDEAALAAISARTRVEKENPARANTRPGLVMPA